MATLDRDVTITWLGHSTFHFATATGTRLLLEAWVDTNPACPEAWKNRIREDGLDTILISHGHGDHIGDLHALADATGAAIVGQFDITTWLATKNLAEDRLVGFNKGGTARVGNISITMTHATHSSTFLDDGVLVPMGSEAGFVIRFENGFSVYYTGDTAVTYDMQLVGELYRPDLVILPIGDYFTMDPRQAAYALKLIGAPRAMPCHYGTFPVLTGTPDALREQVRALGLDVEVIAPAPGESID